MLKKLIENLEIPEEKLPYNIVEKFGNGSNITVPLNICYNLGEELLNRELDVFLGGFGVGLSWAMINMNLGPLEFCKIIDYER